MKELELSLKTIARNLEEKKEYITKKIYEQISRR